MVCADKSSCSRVSEPAPGPCAFACFTRFVHLPLCVRVAQQSRDSAVCCSPPAERASHREEMCQLVLMEIVEINMATAPNQHETGAGIQLYSAPPPEES